MLRLETVEDFEKVDRALNDPNSKLFDYCVEDYGYCSFCRSISAFDRVLGPDHIYCRGCGNNFYPDQLGLSYLYCIEHDWDQPIKQELFAFRIGGDIPERQGSVARDYFSREHQRKLFSEKLGVKITSLKSEQRTLSRQIRRLAKLRK